MGLPFFDSSSKSSSETFAPTVGGQSTSGDVAPVVIKGNDASNSVNINQTTTDNGAMQVAENIASGYGAIASDIVGQGLNNSSYVADTAIRTAGDSLRDVISFGGNILDGAANLVKDAFEQSSFQQAEAMRAANAAFADASKTTGIAIDSNTLISQDSIELARDVVGLTGEINQQNIDYMTSGFNTVNNTVEAMTDSLQASDAVQAQMNSEQLGAITELATAVQTGGESINANVNKVIAVVAVLGIGLVAWRMAGQS
jgi:hypothetical protein